MKTTKEMIEVMQAYERGEQIEVNEYERTDFWVDAKELRWDWLHFDYRVKPKHNKKYVPFETAEEFLAAQREHGIHIKKHNSVKLLNAFVDCLGFIFVSTLNNVLDFKDIFEQCDFLDGTPCGKEVLE